MREDLNHIGYKVSVEMALCFDSELKGLGFEPFDAQLLFIARRYSL